MQSFAAAPKAVGSKYRDNEENMSGAGNLMHDKRVVRGNTYASLVQPQDDRMEVMRQREAQRRRLMRANQSKKRAGTPEPVPGRKHMDIQTDAYLEELTERIVEFEAETQTDFLLDRPPSPLFMPAKIGIDQETEMLDGELFDFDYEVEPILELLCAKTLELGMMEVLEEEEFESLKRHQEDVERRRQSELLEVQRMEAAEKRRADELARRMQQQAAQKMANVSHMQKVVARSIAATHLSSLKGRCFAHLYDAGVFITPMELGVESVFTPQLFKMASETVKQHNQDRQILDSVMKSATTQSLTTHARTLDAERRRLAKIREAEIAAQREQKQRKKFKQEDAKRILREQAKMMKWESKQSKPPKITDWAIRSFDGEAATLEDGRVVPNFAEEGMKEQLQTLLGDQSAERREKVVCHISTDPDFVPPADADPNVMSGSKIIKLRSFMVNYFHVEILEAKGIGDEPCDPFVVIRDVEGLVGDARKTDICKQTSEPQFGFECDLCSTYKLSAIEFDVRDANLEGSNPDGLEDLSYSLFRCHLCVESLYEVYHKTATGEAVELDTWLEANSREKAMQPKAEQGQLHVRVTANFKIPLMLPGSELPVPPKFEIGLAWEFFHPERPVDLDASVVGLDVDEKIVDQVWFQKLKGFNGAVFHSGDDRTGHGDGDDETISFDLGLMPKNIEKIVVCINSYDQQPLDECIKFAYIRLVVDGHSHGFFSMGEGSIPNCTGIFFGAITKTSSGWHMRTTGVAANGSTVQDSLASILSHGKETLGW